MDNVSTILNQLPKTEIYIIKSIAKAGEELGFPVYLVGGFVRDLFIGKPTFDLDFLIDGEAAKFSAVLKDCWSEHLANIPAPFKNISFKKYFTSKLLFEQELLPGQTVIDFASMRTEEYPEPAKPPVVSLAGIDEDLDRRDFSVNAMAISLRSDSFGDLIDKHNGHLDLKNSTLRVLHQDSFIDDPARILRGVRLAKRHGFKFEDATRELLQEAREAGLITHLPARRLFDEFRKALLEPEPHRVLKELDRDGLLVQILPQVKICSNMLKDVVRISESIKQSKELSADRQSWKVILVRILGDLSDSEFEQQLERFGQNEKEIKALFQARESLFS